MAHVIEKGQFFLFRTKDIHKMGLVGKFEFPDEDSFDTTVNVTIVRSHSKKVLAKEGYYRRFVDENTSFDFATYGSADTYELSFRMQRLGFGDFTIWTSGQSEKLEAEIENIPDVNMVICQPLIFAGYEINGSYSDNEGQLLIYDGSVSYRFLSVDGVGQPIPEIMPGTVYITPALRSSFDVEIGDTIQFELSRRDGIKNLEVAGYFADAFMGSSMIDMKSFLINEDDWNKMQELI